MRRVLAAIEARYGAGAGTSSWRVRLRVALTVAAVLAVLALTAVDALISAAVGTRPVTLRVRDGVRALASAYRQARDRREGVIDAEVIEDEGVTR